MNRDSEDSEKSLKSPVFSACMRSLPTTAGPDRARKRPEELKRRVKSVPRERLRLLWAPFQASALVPRHSRDAPESTLDSSHLENEDTDLE